MSALTIAAAFSPIMASALAIVIFRRSAISGALSGIAVAAALLLAKVFQAGEDEIVAAIDTSFVLIVSAVLVIMPGLYLNTVLRARGITDGLVSWVQSLPLGGEQKALILLLGFLPAVESMTGFGVSLFLAVPIFFNLFDSGKAYRLAMLSMNIMPWGTLALATVIGSALTGYSTSDLGTMTASTSSLVYPCIGAIALYVIGGKRVLRKHGLSGVLMGFSLSIGLYGFNKLGFTESAGVLAGVTTSVFGLLYFSSVSQLKSNIVNGRNQLYRLFFPYALVLSLLILTRAVTPLHSFLSNVWILASGDIKVHILTSPGIVLLAVVFIHVFLYRPSIDHKAVWQRVSKSSLSLGCFIFLAQLMSKSGMIAAVAEALKYSETQPKLLLLLSPFLGMVSGFITGSNVGGNALLMNVQEKIGSSLSGNGLLFSALQNSAAGHAVFTSLPIIILIMTIVRDAEVERVDREPATESDLLRFGLTVAVILYTTLVISGVLITHLIVPMSLGY